MQTIYTTHTENNQEVFFLHTANPKSHSEKWINILSKETGETPDVFEIKDKLAQLMDEQKLIANEGNEEAIETARIFKSVLSEMSQNGFCIVDFEYIPDIAA